MLASVAGNTGAAIPSGQWDFYFCPASAGSLSLPLSFLFGLWFKVTLLGFAWRSLSHATGEVSLSEVDGTERGQLVPDPAEPQALVFKGLPKPACQTEPSRACFWPFGEA